MNAVLQFNVLVDGELGIAHSKFVCEGVMNEGLQAHLRECRTCREIIAKDLREFAAQIEGMKKT